MFYPVQAIAGSVCVHRSFSIGYSRIAVRYLQDFPELPLHFR